MTCLLVDITLHPPFESRPTQFFWSRTAQSTGALQIRFASARPVGGEPERSSFEYWLIPDHARRVTPETEHRSCVLLARGHFFFVRRTLDVPHSGAAHGRSRRGISLTRAFEIVQPGVVANPGKGSVAARLDPARSIWSSVIVAPGHHVVVSEATVGRVLAEAATCHVMLESLRRYTYYRLELMHRLSFHGDLPGSARRVLDTVWPDIFAVRCLRGVVRSCLTFVNAVFRRPRLDEGLTMLMAALEQRERDLQLIADRLAGCPPLTDGSSVAEARDGMSKWIEDKHSRLLTQYSLGLAAIVLLIKLLAGG